MTVGGCSPGRRSQPMPPAIARCARGSTPSRRSPRSAWSPQAARPPGWCVTCAPKGLEVLEVTQPHPHTRRRRGRSDPIDAELAARHVLAANRPVVAKDTSEIVEAIRQLRVARDGAVKARSAALNALGGLIVTAPEDLRRQLTARKGTRARARRCERLRPDPRGLRGPEQAARAAARSLARRIAALDGEITLLDQQLDQLVAEAAPITINRV